MPRIKRSFIAVITLICGISAQADNADRRDSLLHQLSIASEDTNKVWLLNELAKNSIQDYSEISQWANQQLELSEDLDYPKGKFYALMNLSDAYFFSAQYERMQQILTEMEEMLPLNDLENEQGIYLLLRARYLKKTGEYDQAAEHLLEARNHFGKIGNQNREADACTDLAILYSNLGQFDEAAKYYKSALSIYEQDGDAKGVSHVLSNMGILAYYQGNLDGAEQYLLRALDLQKEVNSPLTTASCKSSLGNLYIESGRYDEALQLFDENYQTYSALRDTSNMVLAVLQSADAYIEKGDSRYALTLADQALDLLKNSDDLSMIRNTYELMAGAQENLGAFSEALEAYKEINSIEKKINAEETAQKVIEIERRYQFEQQQEEIAALTQQNELSEMELDRNSIALRARTYLTASLSLMLIMLVGGGWFMRRQNQLREQKKAAELEHRALRTQMNPHFIFNALNSIQRIYLEGNIDEANEYIADFSTLMRNILENSNKSSISLHKELETLQLYLELEKLRSRKMIEYSIVVDSEIDQLNTKVPPLVIQPFVENAIWHGILPKKQLGNIDIRITLVNGKIQCEITDDGVGMDPEDLGKSTSKGIAITEQRLGNKVEIKSSKESGTRVVFLISTTT